MHRLSERLARVEHQRGPTDVQIIIITGGLCDFDCAQACIGGETIERDPAEPSPSCKPAPSLRQ
jgi:hypothetical protein